MVRIAVETIVWSSELRNIAVIRASTTSMIWR